MKKKMLIGASALMLMVAAGCGNTEETNKEKTNADTKQEQKQAYTFDLKVNPEKPVSGEFNTFTVEVKGGEKPENVYLYINMEGMNHPIEGTMKEKGDGKYELDLPVAMGGKWYAVIRVLDKDGEVVQSEKIADAFEATGDHAMKYMKGYNADKPNGGLDENAEMNQNTEMNHDNMDHGEMNNENQEQNMNHN